MRRIALGLSALAVAGMTAHAGVAVAAMPHSTAAQLATAATAAYGHRAHRGHHGYRGHRGHHGYYGHYGHHGHYGYGGYYGRYSRYGSYGYPGYYRSRAYRVYARPYYVPGPVVPYYGGFQYYGPGFAFSFGY